MNFTVSFHNLWIFYALAYALAIPMQGWAEKKRGQPIDDPEFLFRGKLIVTLALLWILVGFVISLFTPFTFGIPFIIGVCLYVAGLVVVALTFISFSRHKGLVTTGFHRYSRNPGYVGWITVILGLTLIGWSQSVWSVLFLVYFIGSIAYLNWTVLLEERFLTNKYGEPYAAYLRNTSRYFGVSKQS